MSIKNFFDGGKQISDSTGAPLNGGLCYFYEPTTTTPKNTYTTSALAVANANPVVLDSSGRANIWLNGNYRVIVKDSAGNTIYDEDLINPETATTVTAIASSATLVAADKGKVLEVNGSGITLTLTAAATLGAGWYVDYISTDSTNSFTFGRANTGNTINGTAANLTVYPLQTGRLLVNQAANGFYVQGAGSAQRVAVFSLMTSGIFNDVCDGRLTLTTATPVTTADVTAATTVYFSPYKGNRIALYDGSAVWTLLTFTELSVAVPATTATVYDVFCYNNSGTATLEALAWSSATARATALVLQNGVLVKTGSTTRRYLGSFRTTGSSGQTEDSVANRFVWNYYNRVPRSLFAKDTTNSWTYTTATIRQANASTANQVNFVMGYGEDIIVARVLATASNGSGNVQWAAGIGLDSTTSFATSCLSQVGESAAANVQAPTSATWSGYSGIGYHYLAWLEYSAATGTTTWLGDGNVGFIQAGISATIMG